MTEKKKEVQVDSPRKCIHRYCLLHCNEMERKNSKRSVAECVKRDCPLHPYRTGQLRSLGPLSESEKDRRFIRLRTARRKVERYNRLTEDLSGKAKRLESKMMDFVERKEEAQKELAKAKEKVELLEAEFDKELESGLWK